MIYDNEKLCIKKAYEAKQSIAQKELGEVLSFKTRPFSGFLGEITWSDSTARKFSQILFVLFFIPMLLIWTVVSTIFQFLVIIVKMILLWLRSMGPGSCHVPKDVSEERSLNTLWDCHGLDSQESTSEERFALLECWIKILYGSSAEDLQLRKRMYAISHRHIESNRSHYEETGGHIFFRPPVDSLIVELSNELGQYEKEV